MAGATVADTVVIFADIDIYLVGFTVTAVDVFTSEYILLFE